MGLLPFLQKRRLRLRTREWRDMSRVGTDVLLFSAQFHFWPLTISFSLVAFGWSQERGIFPGQRPWSGLQEVAGTVCSDPGRVPGQEDHGSCHHKYTKLLGEHAGGNHTLFPGPPSPRLPGLGSGGLLVLNNEPGLWATMSFSFSVTVFVVQVNEWRQLFPPKLRVWLPTTASCGWCYRWNLN